MNPDDNVCLCFRVTRRKLVNWVKVNRPKVPSQLAECGGAGTGCGWCIPFLKRIHRDGTATPGDPDLDAVTAEEYAARRDEYVRAGKGTPPG